MTSLQETGRDAEYDDAKASQGRTDKRTSGEEKESTVAETFHESAVSHDKPMERKSPQAPFALVGLAYLAVLAVIGLIIGIVLFALS